MNYRTFGRTGWKVSEISFGAWAIGGAWGRVDDTESLAALNASHRLRRELHRHRRRLRHGPQRTAHRATQARAERGNRRRHQGRAPAVKPHTADGYNEKNLAGFVEDSLRNLSTDCLDLLQLHCPPTDVYYRPEVFGALDRLVEAGKIRYYGVSVERVEEALKAIEFPNVQTVQIIFNCFRHRPADLFFEQRQAERGGHSGARPAVERHAHRQADRGIAVRRRRSPQFQSPRRGVRRGRDVFRGGLRNRRWKRSKRCARCCRPASAWRSSPCAGY